VIFVEGLDDLLDVLKQMALVWSAVKHHCHPVVAICARGSLERRRASMVVQFALARIDWRRSPVLVLTARSRS